MCCGILCKLLAFALAGLGIAAIIIGAVLGFAVLPNKISDEVERRVVLEEGTSQFDRWRNLSFNQQLRVTFFEVENAIEIQNGQATNVRVSERGPYIYSQVRKRNVRNINPDDNTISYTESRQLVFDSTASSPRTENDVVTMFNAPLFDLLQMVEHMLPVANIDNEIQVAFPGSAGLFNGFTVRVFLFDGFRFCQNHLQAPFFCGQSVDHIHYMQREADQSISFAFLRHKIDEPNMYEIRDGRGVVRDLGLIVRWNGMVTVPADIWGTTGRCKHIEGQDGTIFPPSIQRNDEFDIFYSDVCRLMTLGRGDNEDFEDIPSQRRTFQANNLHNTEANQCFCARRTRMPDGQPSCWPNGFLDLGTCTGAHIVLSYPHFLDATEFGTNVIGLSPTRNLHESYVVLEPGTGTPLKIVRRFQYNMVLRNLPQVTITQGVPPSVVPLLWIEETMQLPEELMDKIRDKYLEELRTVTIITWVLIGGGIAMFLASILLKCLCC